MPEISQEAAKALQTALAAIVWQLERMDIELDDEETGEPHPLESMLSDAQAALKLAKESR